MVSPAATAAESGVALLTAASGITDAAADKRYLIKLEPGIYDLGTSQLAVPAFVDVEGSGPAMTEITSTSSSGTMSASGVQLRQFTARNTLAAGASALIGTAVRLDFVSARIAPSAVTSGTTVAAVQLSGESELHNADVRAEGGGAAGTVEGVSCTAGAIGAYNTFILSIDAATVNAVGLYGGCLFTSRVSRFNANTGTNVRAVYVESGRAALNQGFAYATSATGAAHGVLSIAGAVLTRGVDVVAFDTGSGSAAAIEVQGTSPAVVISSTLRSNVGLINSGTGTAQIAASQVTGGVQGAVTCTTSYDGNFVSPGLNVCP